jgi:hypothetical protein
MFSSIFTRLNEEYLQDKDYFLKIDEKQPEGQSNGCACY